MARKGIDFRYENRLLVYVDVMGWSDITRRSSLDPEAKERVGQLIRVLLDGAQSFDVEADWQATLLSDSLAVSFRDLGKESTWVLLDQLPVMMALPILRYGTYLRGSVVFGELFHQGNVIVGPAMVLA